MEVIEYVEKIDNIITSINKDYKYIYDDIHNYLNDGKVSYDQLINFEVSLEDLSIQLNSLVFLFKQIQIESQVELFNPKKNNNYNTNNYNTNNYNTNNYNTNNYKEDKIKQYIKEEQMNTKIDKIIDKTIFNILPLLFLYFMVIDKESILYLKDFVENKNNKSNNTKEEEYNNKCKNIINNIFNEEYILNDLD